MGERELAPERILRDGNRGLVNRFAVEEERNFRLLAARLRGGENAADADLVAEEDRFRRGDVREREVEGRGGASDKDGADVDAARAELAGDGLDGGVSVVNAVREDEDARQLFGGNVREN